MSECWEGRRGHAVLPLGPECEGGDHDAGPGPAQIHGHPHGLGGLTDSPGSRKRPGVCEVIVPTLLHPSLSS